MAVLTFDQLPEAVCQLLEDNKELKRLLLERSTSPTQPDEVIFTVPQAAEFLSLSVATIYSLISRGELPAMRRNGRVYFSKSDLLDYLKAGRKKTNYEIEAEAAAYTNKKRPAR